MERAQKLLAVIEVGNEVGNQEMVRQGLIELGKLYGLLLTVFDIKTFNTPELEALMQAENRAIAWIKLFRELTAGINGTPFIGLKEAKDEYDRRAGR